MAIYHSIKESIWIQKFLNKQHLEQTVRRIEIFRDNKTNLILMRNSESQNYTKHIDIIYYYIWGLVENKELEINWIYSLLMLADELRKVLPIRPFRRLWDD